MSGPSIENEELAELLWSLYTKALDSINHVPIDRERTFVEGSNAPQIVFAPQMESLEMRPLFWDDYEEFDQIVENLVDCDYYPHDRHDLEEKDDIPVEGQILGDVIDGVWRGYLRNSELIGGEEKETFVEVFSDFEKYYRSERVPFRARGVIEHLHLDADEVELQPNLRLRSPTSYDKNWMVDNHYSMSDFRRSYTAQTIVECEFEDKKEAIQRTEYDRQTFERVETALRLFQPRATPELVYLRSEPKLKYTSSLTHGSSVLLRKSGIRYNLCEIDQSESEEFADFYHRYGVLLRTESDDGEFSRPLRRFRAMGDKHEEEDCIVDCVIALEGTLLDGMQNSSIRFRLGLRGGMLLDGRLHYSREEIREYLETLYYARGEIVHSDKQLERVLDEIADSEDYSIQWTETPSPRDYVQQARRFLAEVLLAYMDARIDRDTSIIDVNNGMDDAARNATYSP